MCAVPSSQVNNHDSQFGNDLRTLFISSGAHVYVSSNWPVCASQKNKQMTVTSIKASLTLASPPVKRIYNFLFCVHIVLYSYHHHGSYHIECDHLCISHSQPSARQSENAQCTSVKSTSFTEGTNLCDVKKTKTIPLNQEMWL